MADTHAEALTRYGEAIDALRSQREQIREDLAFSDPSNPDQWDADERTKRETDPGGARPCLVLDQTGQYVANVAGQVEQRPPAIHAIPVDGGADRKVAESLDGLYRHIEHTSRAQQHYARALTSAARAGVGYLIVRPEFTDRALNYQEPRISSEGDPLRVVLDPWSVEIDGSDADFGYLLTPLSHREFERRYGKRKKVSFGDDEGKTVEDERQSIVIAEEWRIEEKTRNLIMVTDPADPSRDRFAVEEDEYWERDKSGQPLQVLTKDDGSVWTYKDKYKCVKWTYLSGAEPLSEEQEYPADGIGIVPVYGYVGWAGGRMTYCGIPRRARAPQQAYNFHMSEMRALMATAPKTPWIGPKRAFRGVETLWDRASVDSRAFLPYNDVDEAGQVIAAPFRAPVAINLANHGQNAEMALKDIQASIGMYQANLGAPSNETSGIAIESRKQQGEASTAHFPSHLAASLGQVGKLCMQMVQKLVDTPRQMRILGIDQMPGTVRIDPKQTQAMQDTPQGVSINPNVGTYDVRVVVGASFSTQRQQAQQAYTEMMRANPQMMPAIAPLWAQTLDVPHADKLAQVLTAMAPDPVKAILSPDGEDSTAKLKAENDQLKQALQEALSVAQEAQQEIASSKAEQEAKEEENAIKAYDAQTKRLAAMKDAITPEQVQMLVVQTIERMMSNPEPMPGEPQPEQPETYEMQPFPGQLEQPNPGMGMEQQ